MARPKKYIANKTLFHNGKLFAPGDTINLQSESEHTLRLLDQKDISDIAVTTPPPEKEKPVDEKPQDETTADKTL